MTQALREKALKAAKGPWRNVDSVVIGSEQHSERYGADDAQPDHKAVAYCGDEIRHRMGLPFGDERDNNANFIAAANPAVVLSLLDEIDRLRELVGEATHRSSHDRT